MKIYTIGLGLLLCLTACEPATAPDAPTSANTDGAGLSQWISSLGKQAQSAEASSAAPWYVKSPWFNAWRAEEAETFKRFPGQASRSGDDLTISFAGKPTARFSDINKAECEGNGTCSLWSFAGFTELQSAPGKTETFAVIANNNGEQNSNLLLNAKGEFHWVGDTFKVSLDRRFVLAGEQESIMSEGFLEVTDFASPRHAAVARFDAQCDPDNWDKAAAEVICSRGDDNSIEVMAVVEQTAPGQWLLREYKVRKNDSTAGVELRTRTATTATESLPPNGDDGKGHEGEIGFHRLTD